MSIKPWKKPKVLYNFIQKEMFPRLKCFPLALQDGMKHAVTLSPNVLWKAATWISEDDLPGLEEY